MTIGLADLRDRVAQKLGVLGEGEDLDGADATLIENAITEHHEELVANGKALWDLSAVPEQFVRPLVTILAEELCAEFGLAPQKCEVLAKQRREAEGRLAALTTATTGNGEPVQAEYF